MCGRARCTLKRPQIEAAAKEVAGGKSVDCRGLDNYTPSGNLYPGCCLPVLEHSAPPRAGEASAGAATAAAASTAASADAGAALPFTLRAAKWGLVPFYAKPALASDGKHPKFEYFKMFNARSETVATSGVFKRLVDRHRVVVLIDAFYEWKADGTKHKQPFAVRRADGKPLMIAGLSDSWRPHHAGKGKGGDGTAVALPPDSLANPPGVGMHDATPATLTSGETSAAAGSGAESDDDGAGTAAATAGLGHDGSDDDGHDAAAGDDAGASASSSSSSASAASATSSSSPADGDGPVLHTVTLLTRHPTAELSWLHDRMPVILKDDHDVHLWLSNGTVPFAELAAARGPNRLASLADDLPAGLLVWHPCDKVMNNLKYQGADAGKAIDLKEAAAAGTPTGKGGGKKGGAAHTGPTLHSFFGKAAASSSSTAAAPTASPARAGAASGTRTSTSGDGAVSGRKRPRASSHTTTASADDDASDDVVVVDSDEEKDGASSRRAASAAQPPPAHAVVEVSDGETRTRAAAAAEAGGASKPTKPATKRARR